MMQVVFNFIISVITFLVKYFSGIFNLAFETYLPDVSEQIVTTTNTIVSFINNITWPLSLIPSGFLNTLLFIITIEIARHTIYLSTHFLIRVWNLFQKIKFW